MGKSVLLIVIEAAAQRALFNKYLKATPHSLVFCTDGEDGFERFAEIKPDLVIAHANAARLDGTVLCSLIRKQPGGSEVPIVLIGEQFVDPVLGEAKKRAVDADAFLAVPFTKNALIQCITPLLAFGRLAEEDTGVTPAAFDDPDPPTAPIPEPTDEYVVPRHSEESDLDTVVSFKNPFYRPEVESPTDYGAILRNDSPTEVHLEDELLESARKLTDPAERNARPIQSSDEVPTGPDMVDPLAEPKIDTGVRRVDRPTNSDLIQEPVREMTPSASNEQRISQLKNGPQASRRGLDESQLGKRLAKRVRAMYKLLEHVDYYQLLGLEPNATLQQITDAYFEHSLEFHPDRFFLLRSGDLKEKIYEIYRHIGQAYRILSDERARKRYDLERAQGMVPAPPPEIIRPIEPKRPNGGLSIPTVTVEAERFVNLASEAMSVGDLNGARLHLHLALTYERGNAELRDAIAEVARKMRPR